MTVSEITDALLECLFPVQCGACEQGGKTPFCDGCEVWLEDAPAFTVPGYDLVAVRYTYDGPIMEAIRAFKFNGRFELGIPLGRRMMEVWPPGRRPDVVIPVPSSTDGLRTRGYSPARELARALPFPVHSRAVKRQGDRASQVGLSQAQRLKNQLHAFRVDPRAVSGRVVLVVDDVVTTGATLDAMRFALLAAGARSCMAVVLARST